MSYLAWLRPEGNLRSAACQRPPPPPTSPTPASPHHQGGNEGYAPTRTRRLALAARINQQARTPRRQPSPSVVFCHD